MPKDCSYCNFGMRPKECFICLWNRVLAIFFVAAMYAIGYFISAMLNKQTR